MLYVINYANKKFGNAQKLNSKTARKIGKADKVIEYSELDIDEIFYNENKKILSQKRGNGYWLWKSYIILKTLEVMNDGEYLMYCDSGSYFVNDINLLIDEMKKNNDDIMSFQLPFFEKCYSKRDAFILMNCDEREYYDTKQILATISIYKKSAKTIKFVQEWLNYAKDERIITDIPNECGSPNYDSFIENRHDQTIFSLLCKKHKIKPYRDPSQYGTGIKLKNSSYPQIIQLHRYGFAKTIVGIKLYAIFLPIVMPIYKKIFR